MRKLESLQPSELGLDFDEIEIAAVISVAGVHLIKLAVINGSFLF